MYDCTSRRYVQSDHSSSESLENKHSNKRFLVSSCSLCPYSSFEAVTSLYRLVKERAPPEVNGILVSTKNDVTADQRAGIGSLIISVLAIGC